uniref:40S ribosomal protein S25 n=1 Tax=Schistosoma japonicum TaxID=6182 RepID=C7TY47_SCHJA|nr:Ribosomal protein S25 [Schistosoma japonicum]
MVLFDNPTFEKLLTDFPHYSVITPSEWSKRLMIRASLDRQALEELRRQGSITMVCHQKSQQIYTRTTKVE